MKIVILLTACINAGETIYTVRKDPKIRESDYIKALKKWEKETDLPIVFCENSDSDLTRIKAIANPKSDNNNERIEFFSFDGNNNPKLGKSYGEMEIIKYALLHSELIKNADFIIKVSGRYFIKNFKKLVDEIKSYQKVDVITTFQHDRKFAETLFFGAAKSFYETYFIKYHSKINGTEKYFIQTALYDSITEAQTNGAKCFEFKIEPVVKGISARTNLRIKPDDFRKQNKYLYFAKKLKPFLDSTRGIRSKLGLRFVQLSSKKENTK
ncbi:MAG: hypothetical protein K9G44_04355 [Melioribacteraceae bacterium]|nr:hypothetical protein [Melioribacteraceae bacterium]